MGSQRLKTQLTDFHFSLHSEVYISVAEIKQTDTCANKKSKKASLKCHMRKMKITASSPITSGQIEGEKVEIVTDFMFLGSKITTDGDCSHENKRRLLPGRKATTNLDCILKSRDITLPTRLHIVMCGCKSWTIKKAE